MIEKKYDYAGAPITVRYDGVVKELDVEVDRDGDVCLTLTVRDRGSFTGTVEECFYVLAEEWDAIVTHVADQRLELQ